MSFEDKVYWVTDKNGKRHLMNVKERTIFSEDKQMRMKRLLDMHADGLRRLAESDYKPFPSDYLYWEKQAKEAYARGKFNAIYQPKDDN